MEDTLVSARMPRAKKEAVAVMLANMGSNATELINAAYDFVLAEHALPGVLRSNNRSKEDFERFLRESTLDIDWGEGVPDGDYRAFARQARLEDYESLA